MDKASQEQEDQTVDEDSEKRWFWDQSGQPKVAEYRALGRGSVLSLRRSDRDARHPTSIHRTSLTRTTHRPEGMFRSFDGVCHGTHAPEPGPSPVKQVAAWRAYWKCLKKNSWG